MESALKIRNYEEKDKEQILQLHRDALERVTLEEYPIYRNNLERRLVPEQTIVADAQGKVEGFVSFERFDNIPYDNLMHYLRMLVIAQMPSRKDRSRNELKGIRDQLGRGRVTLQYFDLAQRIDEFHIPGKSVMGANMVVSEKYRKNGLGYALAQYALQTILPAQAPAIFTQLIDKNPSVLICKKLGFKSLLRYGPSYPDGSATHLMVYIPPRKSS